MEAYQWIFSGVGVAVLGLLAKFFWPSDSVKPDKINAVNESPNSVSIIGDSNTVTQAPGTNVSELPVLDERVTAKTPLMIKQEIDSYPPLHQSTIAREFRGMRVNWTLVLSSARETDSGHARLQLVAEDSDSRYMSPSVFCTVATSEYPGIRLWKKGHRVAVRGVIGEVDPIELSEVVLHELDQPPEDRVP